MTRVKMMKLSIARSRSTSRSRKPRFTADHLDKDIMTFHAGLRLKQERDAILMREKCLPEDVRYVLDVFLENTAPGIIRKAKDDPCFQADLLAFFNSF